MFDQQKEYSEEDERRSMLWYRIKTALIGSVAVIVIGSLLMSFYTYYRYGGTPFDGLLGRKRGESKDVGKLAYDKRTGGFIGIIKGEGHSKVYGSKVYYIERSAGQWHEYPKDMIEVREPGKK